MINDWQTEGKQMLSISKQFKIIMLENDLKQVEVAEKLGYTKQGFNNLLNKDDYKLKDIIKIADIIGYDIDIIFKKRDQEGDA